MKYLIVYAHPSAQSHAANTLQEFTKKLSETGHYFEVLDLYKMKFNPLLEADELYNKDDKRIDPRIKQLQDKVSAADTLVFIFPVWWNGTPAIMKGFFDRVFSAGFAFKYVGGIPHGLLKGKRAIIFATTGANKLLSSFFMGGRWRTVIEKDILGFCGIKAKTYHIGGVRAMTQNDLIKIRSNVNHALRATAKVQLFGAAHGTHKSD
jgi:NAD(P)H dehydrogenase (quinone)